MLVYCWASIVADGPLVKQHCIKVCVFAATTNHYKGNSHCSEQTWSVSKQLTMVCPVHHQTLNQCWFYIGPATWTMATIKSTLVQHLVLGWTVRGQHPHTKRDMLNNVVSRLAQRKRRRNSFETLDQRVLVRVCCDTLHTL